MNRLCSQRLALLAIAACLPVATQAQVQHSPFMTATGSVASVNGGQFDQTIVASAELTLGTRFRKTERLTIVLGAFAGSSVGVNHDEVTSCGAVSSCSSAVAVPDIGLSDFKYAGLSAGIETKFHFLALSVLTGPELFYSQSQVAYSYPNVNGQPTRYEVGGIANVGVHSRADASVLFGAHFALVVSGTARYFPHFRNAVTHMNGLGLGLRVQ